MKKRLQICSQQLCHRLLTVRVFISSAVHIHWSGGQKHKICGMGCHGTTEMIHCDMTISAILVSFTPFLYYSSVLICRMSLCTYIIWLAGWHANKARQKMYMQLHDIQSTTLRYNLVVWHTPHKPYTCGQQRSATESATGRLI